MQKIDRTGETNIATNGQKMTITGYRRSDDIDIQFKDGTVVTHKDYKSFKKGNIKNPNCVISGISYNELFCFEQLKQFGFIKAEKGTLKELGLEQKELDLYNPGLKIGIEYDGGVYKKELKHHTIEKDLKKDLLCEQAGITLYRIRESQLPRYNSSSIKYYLKDNSRGSQNLIDIISSVVKDINSKFNTNFEYKYKIKEIKLKNIQSKMKQKRVGESNIATNGQAMTIIEYRKYHDIDVQFEDGTVVREKKYSSFKQGLIKNPNYTQNRLGTKKKNNNGQIMTIIEYRNYKDIDIQFEDGVIVKHKNYDKFQKGSIKNPNLKNIQIKNKTGKTNIATNGQAMTIIEYRNNNDIDVRFEDETIVKNRTYNSFKLGMIKNPNYNNELILKNNKIGETNIANNKQVMTIIEYINAKDIDIQFEDGTIVKHKSYKCFKRGKIKNPNLSNTNIKSRIGETNINKNGQTMTIIKYRRNNDIDVQFEDGTIVKHKTYNNFKKGLIKNPNYIKKVS